MPSPVIEQIADTIVTRLRTIAAGLTTTDGDPINTTDGTRITDTDGGPYSFDVSSVQRPDRKGTPTAANYLVIVEQTTTERNEDLSRASATGLQVAWNTEFQITCFLRPSDTDTTALDQLSNLAISDMTRAIASSGTWYLFDGQAVDATFTGQEQFSDDSGAGVRLMLQVTYRIDESDPRTARP